MMPVDEFPAPGPPVVLGRLGFDDLAEIVDVLSDAFRDYPVMRYVLDGAGPYDAGLRRLVELFVSGRAYRNEPMIGLHASNGKIIGAATMTLPKPQEPPASFLAVRESIWSELGARARARYEAFAAATHRFTIPSPHHHLNMIGVRGTHQGRGLPGGCSRRCTRWRPPTASRPV
jgi:hypothetical protein